MKYFLIILTSLLTINTYAQTAATHQLKITVTDIQKIKGNVKLGVFDDAKNFLVAGKEYKSASKKVTAEELTFTLTGLPKGTYAVSLFHDVNADGKCNLNFIGIPIEPYAFSNNFKPKFAKPNFSDCDIDLNQNQAIRIKLIN